MDESILFISDTHINSTVALCNPSSVLDDGATLKPSKSQEALLRVWESTLDQVEKKKAPIHWTIFNGDLAEGDAKNRSYQVFTQNQSTIVKWTAELLEPAVQMSKGVFFVRGTAAHGGKSNHLEELVATQFKKYVIPDDRTNQLSWWWLPFESQGVRMDIAHHPRTAMSSNVTNRWSGIDRLAWTTMLQYAEVGQVPPDLVVRSHFHVYRDSQSRYRTRALITPGWSLLTEHSLRMGSTDFDIADMGMILVHTHAGRFEVEPILETHKVRPFVSSANLPRRKHGHQSNPQ